MRAIAVPPVILFDAAFAWIRDSCRVGGGRAYIGALKV